MNEPKSEASNTKLTNSSPRSSSDDSFRKRKVARWICVLGLLTILLIGLGLVWLPGSRVAPIQDLTFVPGGTDEQAESLVARMLQVNRPWLEPKPVFASYSLAREWHDYSLIGRFKHERYKLGPYSVTPGCRRALRVGSIVRCPLQAMLAQATNFTVRMLGHTIWKGTNLVAVEVVFGSPIQCDVGMGGQANATFSSERYGVETARMLINEGRAIPIVIQTAFTSGRPKPTQRRTMWEFAPQFFELDNGYAPRAFDFRDGEGLFAEHQEFQVVNGAWIFDWGRAVIPYKASPGRSLADLIGDVLTLGHANQKLQLHLEGPISTGQS
jgi:hypothetical protein